MERKRLSALFHSLVAMALVWSFDARDARAGDGTYFALEVDGGAAFGLGTDQERPGYSAGVSLGLGGRPGGMPIRLYILAAYNRNNLEVDGSVFDLDRTVNSLLFGPRVIVPLFAGLRLFCEALLGPAWVSSKLEAVSGHASIEQDTETRFAYSLGVGLQYRILENLSLGIKASFQDEDKDDDDPILVPVTGSPGDPGMRISASGFMTLHF